MSIAAGSLRILTGAMLGVSAREKFDLRTPRIGMSRPKGAGAFRMRNIETRWHKLIESARCRRIRLASLKEFEDPRFAPYELVNPYILEDLLRGVSSVPRLVVDRTALELVSTEQAMFSVSDMLACGVLHLPFERCVVEFESNNLFYNVLMEEKITLDGATHWSLSAFGYRGALLNDDAVLVFPCKICLKVHQSSEALEDTDVNTPDLPEISYSVESEPYIGRNPSIERLMTDTAPTLLQRCMTAFLAAVILPRTVGLDQEERSVKPAFNRAREAKGRSAIPSYTLLSVKNYVPGDRAIAVAGRSQVAVHLRRAHKKRVACGEGRSQRAWRFIPPQVVGYLPDGRKPSMPEMLASRAIKPYVLK